MILKVLPQDMIVKLREKSTDPLTDAYKKEKEFLEKTTCPRCASKVHHKINARTPFTEGRLLPNILIECGKCGIEADPYSGLITKA